MDAVLDVFQKFLDFGMLATPLVVVGAIFFGGLLAGMATEYAGRRWR